MHSILLNELNKQRTSKDDLDIILSTPKNILMYFVPHEGNRTGSFFTEIYNEHREWYYVCWALADVCSSSKQRAKKYDYEFDLTLRSLAEIYLEQKGRCYITNMILGTEKGCQEHRNPYRLSIDRIDNNYGYTRDNVRLLTHWANNAKSTWPEEILTEFIKSCVQPELI